MSYLNPQKIRVSPLGSFKTIFKSKVDHGKNFGKWFWSYLVVKNKYSEGSVITFFTFFQIFEWRGWNHFLGKQGTVFVLKLPWGQKRMFWVFENDIFHYFANYWGGHSIITFVLRGRRVHQNANIWNREEGDFTSMRKFTCNFSTEHIVHELPTIITRLYTRKRKQAA